MSLRTLQSMQLVRCSMSTSTGLSNAFAHFANSISVSPSSALGAEPSVTLVGKRTAGEKDVKVRRHTE